MYQVRKLNCIKIFFFLEVYITKKKNPNNKTNKQKKPHKQQTCKWPTWQSHKMQTQSTNKEMFNYMLILFCNFMSLSPQDGYPMKNSLSNMLK